MQARPDYDEFNPTDIEPVGMDFINDLAPGEVITGANVTLLVLRGTDPDPQAHLTGPVAIIGTQVSQMLGNLIGGVKYRLIFVAMTATKPGVTLYADVFCRDPAVADGC